LTTDGVGANDWLVSAECYWCSSTDDLRNPPLGACSDCWVFACELHAERDTNIGKWKCFDGVAKLLSAAAGLDDVDEVEDTPIADPAELAERFPRIAAATEVEREYWSRRTGELAEASMRVAPDRTIAMAQADPERILLAHAVGIVRHFLPPPARLEAAAEARLVSGRLGHLLRLV
jgi:hypothetical protein